MHSVRGYASATSVAPGERIAFHVRAVNGAAGPFRLDLFRRGEEDDLLWSYNGLAEACTTPDDAYRVGCGWPEACALTIPESWPSGLYAARFASDAGDRDPSHAVFVVRGRERPKARVLVAIPFATKEAY